MLAMISRMFSHGPRKTAAPVGVAKLETARKERAAPRLERSRYQYQYQSPRSYGEFLIFRA